GVRRAVERGPALSLPALCDEQGLLAVPALGLYREAAAKGLAAVRFRPLRNLSGVGYCLA
ncbi:MAG TPA: hypothetical protein PK694_08385, partial [Rhodospirillales bacterium]|nr:hypothetical protein [Rhodospirillales bacterium]